MTDTNRKTNEILAELRHQVDRLEADLHGQAQAKHDLGRIIAQKDEYIRSLEAKLRELCTYA